MRFRINEKLSGPLFQAIGLLSPFYHSLHTFSFSYRRYQKASGRKLGTCNKFVFYSSTPRIKISYTTPFVFKWFQECFCCYNLSLSGKVKTMYIDRLNKVFMLYNVMCFSRNL
jgi:hypothetical protein